MDINEEITKMNLYKTFAGLEVPHAHIHLIPIQKESDMIFSNPKLKLANEEFVEIARTINEAWEGLK